MAVVKVATTKNITAALKYLLETESHDGIHDRIGSISAQLMDPYNSVVEARDTLKRFAKYNYSGYNEVTPEGLDKEAIEGYVLIQSFHNDELDPDDQLDLDKANEAGHELARRLYGDDRQFLVVTQADNGVVHNHIVAVNARFTDGRAIRGRATSFYKTKQYSDEILAQMGIRNINAEREAEGKENKSFGEVKAEARGEYIWKNDLATRIQDCMTFDWATDKESFITAMAERGVDVRFRGKGISYSFTDEEGKQRRIRGSKMSSEFQLENLVKQMSANADAQRDMGIEAVASDGAEKSGVEDPEWVRFLKERITWVREDNVLESHDDFIEGLEKYGIKVQFRGKNVSYAFTDKEGKKRRTRGVTLGKEYDVESLEEQYKREEQHLIDSEHWLEMRELDQEVRMIQKAALADELQWREQGEKTEERNTVKETRVEPEKVEEEEMFEVVSEFDESFKDKVARRQKSKETKEIKLPKIHIGPEKMEPEPEPEEEFVEEYEDEIPADLVDDHYEEPEPEPEEFWQDSVGYREEPDGEYGKVHEVTDEQARAYADAVYEAELAMLRDIICKNPDYSYKQDLESASEKIGRERAERLDKRRERFFEKLEERPIEFFELNKKFRKLKKDDPNRPTFGQLWKAFVYTFRMEREMKKLGFSSFEEAQEFAVRQPEPVKYEVIPGFTKRENDAVFRASKVWHDIQDDLDTPSRGSSDLALTEAKVKLEHAREQLSSGTKGKFSVKRDMQNWEKALDEMIEQVDEKLETAREAKMENMTPVERFLYKQKQMGMMNPDHSMKPKFLGREFG